MPTEHLHENIEEKLKEQGGSRQSWSMYLAISTALMAVFAALGSLFAGHHSNEALLCQLKASDNWNYYQAKGIKAEISGILKQIGPDSVNAAALDDKIKQYRKDQENIKKDAEAETEESEAHLSKHVTLARSVTIFQIAIAISAIAMLTGRRFLWYFSLIFSVAGLSLFSIGLI